MSSEHNVTTLINGSKITCLVLSDGVKVNLIDLLPLQEVIS